MGLKRDVFWQRVWKPVVVFKGSHIWLASMNSWRIVFFRWLHQHVFYIFVLFGPCNWVATRLKYKLHRDSCNVYQRVFVGIKDWTRIHVKLWRFQFPIRPEGNSWLVARLSPGLEWNWLQWLKCVAWNRHLDEPVPSNTCTRCVDCVMDLIIVVCSYRFSWR